MRWMDEAEGQAVFYGFAECHQRLNESCMEQQSERPSSVDENGSRIWLGQRSPSGSAENAEDL